MPKIKINDVKIYYDVKGEGEPICLIIGWGASSVMWIDQPELLSKTHKVILIDNRGGGRSSKPDIPYTMKMFVEDIKGVLDHLNITKLHLLGHSMGGMIVQNFALTYPKMLNSLILCCTSPFSMVPNILIRNPVAWFIKTKFTPESIKNLLSAIFTKKYVDFLFQKSFDEEIENYQKLIRVAIKYPPNIRGMNNQFSAIKDHNTLNRLGEIEIPTLIIAGRQDFILPPRHSKILAKYIPNSEFKILEGGHGLYVEAEKEFHETIIDFLNRNKIFSK